MHVSYKLCIIIASLLIHKYFCFVLIDYYDQLIKYEVEDGFFLHLRMLLSPVSHLWFYSVLLGRTEYPGNTSVTFGVSHPPVDRPRRFSLTLVHDWENAFWTSSRCQCLDANVQTAVPVFFSRAPSFSFSSSELNNAFLHTWGNNLFLFLFWLIDRCNSYGSLLTYTRLTRTTSTVCFIYLEIPVDVCESFLSKALPPTARQVFSQ